MSEFCSMSESNWAKWVKNQKLDYSFRQPNEKGDFWATPVTIMVSHLNGCVEISSKRRILRKSGENFSMNLVEQLQIKDWANPQVYTDKIKLNPNWVEQLMGLPVGWTQL